MRPTRSACLRWQPAAARHDRVGPATSRKAAVKLRTFFVEDNPTIRENPIGTLQELAAVSPWAWPTAKPPPANGWTPTRSTGTWSSWMCSCARAPAWACWRPAGAANQGSARWCSATTPRPTCAGAAPNWVDAVFDKSGDIEALVDYCRELASHLSGPLHERGTHSG